MKEIIKKNEFSKDVFWSILEQKAQEGAQAMIMKALENEIAEYSNVYAHIFNRTWPFKN
jgi:hypothetical protein